MPEYSHVWNLVAKPDRIHPDLMPSILRCIEHRFLQPENDATLAPITVVKKFISDKLIDRGAKEPKEQFIAAAWRLAIRCDVSPQDLEFLFKLLSDGNSNVKTDILRLLKHNDAPEFDNVFPDGNQSSLEQVRKSFEKLRKLREWVDIKAPVVGRYRMFFPVVEDLDEGNEGWLVAARIRVINCAEIPAGTLEDLPEEFHSVIKGEGDRLLVAPWTFYVPIDEPDDPEKKSPSKKSLSHLRRDLHKAITSIAEQLSISRSHSPNDLIYLLELEPLSPNDVPKPLEEFRSSEAPLVQSLLTAGKLSAKSFYVSGESIGLGIFLAAVAALTGYSFRRCIATGAIQNAGSSNYNITGISGVRGKLAVIREFLNCVDDPQSCVVLFPAANANKVRSENLSALMRAVLHEVPGPLAEAIKPAQLMQMFTDGFDEWRNRLGISELQERVSISSTNGHVVGDEAHATPFCAYFDQHSQLDNVNENAADDVGGNYNAAFLPSDKKEYRQVLNHLKSAFHKTEPVVKLNLSVAVPFNEDPSAVSDWLCCSISRDCWSGKWTKERLSDVPVIVPVYLELLDQPGIPSDEASSVIAELIRQSLDKGPFPRREQSPPFGVSIRMDAIQNALNRPGKLILIVSDRKSLDIPCGEVSPKKVARTAVWASLMKLAESGQAGVVMICSDEHYQRMMMSRVAMGHP